MSTKLQKIEKLEQKLSPIKIYIDKNKQFLQEELSKKYTEYLSILKKIEDKIDTLKEDIKKEEIQNKEMSDLIEGDRNGIKLGLNKSGFAKIKGQIKGLKNIKDEAEQKEAIEKLLSQCKKWSNKHKSDKKGSDVKRLQHIKEIIPKLENRVKKLTISLEEEVLDEVELKTETNIGTSETGVKLENVSSVERSVSKETTTKNKDGSALTNKDEQKGKVENVISAEIGAEGLKLANSISTEGSTSNETTTKNKDGSALTIKDTKSGKIENVRSAEIGEDALKLENSVSAEGSISKETTTKNKDGSALTKKNEQKGKVENVISAEIGAEGLKLANSISTEGSISNETTTKNEDGSALTIKDELSGRVENVRSAEIGADGLKLENSISAGGKVSKEKTIKTADGTELTNKTADGTELTNRVEATAEVTNKSTLAVGADGLTAALGTSVDVGVKTESSIKRGDVELTSTTEASANLSAGADLQIGKDGVKAGINAAVEANLSTSTSVKTKAGELKLEADLAAKAAAEASLKVGLTGAKVEAVASAEAEASTGIVYNAPDLKLGDLGTVHLSLRPTITAYAKAEAVASAALGVSTGVEFGATAAIGLKGGIECALHGELNFGSFVVPKKDLGSVNVEVSLELSVGVAIKITPISVTVKKEKVDGNEISYDHGMLEILVNLPAAGPAGAGLGIKVDFKLCSEIRVGILKQLQQELLKVVKKVIEKIVHDEYKNFERQVHEQLKVIGKKAIEDLCLVFGHIGTDLNRMHDKLERHNKKLTSLHKTCMKGKVSRITTRPILEVEIHNYNTYLIGILKNQKKSIAKTIEETKVQVAELKNKEGSMSDEDSKSLEAINETINETILALENLLSSSSEVFDDLLIPNQKVLKINQKILKSRGLVDFKKDVSALIKDLKDCSKIIA